MCHGTAEKTNQLRASPCSHLSRSHLSQAPGAEAAHTYLITAQPAPDTHRHTQIYLNIGQPEQSGPVLGWSSAIASYGAIVIPGLMGIAVTQRNLGESPCWCKMLSLSFDCPINHRFRTCVQGPWAQALYRPPNTPIPPSQHP